MQIILRNRRNDRIQIENRNGVFLIDDTVMHNKPLTTKEISLLHRGDCVTQLSLESVPENLWIVDTVEDSPIHGLIVHMLNGTRLYVGNLQSPALYFQFSMLG